MFNFLLINKKRQKMSNPKLENLCFKTINNKIKRMIYYKLRLMIIIK